MAASNLTFSLLRKLHEARGCPLSHHRPGLLGLNPISPETLCQISCLRSLKRSITSVCFAGPRLASIFAAASNYGTPRTRCGIAIQSDPDLSSVRAEWAMCSESSHQSGAGGIPSQRHGTDHRHQSRRGKAKSSSLLRGNGVLARGSTRLDLGDPVIIGAHPSPACPPRRRGWQPMSATPPNPSSRCCVRFLRTGRPGGMEGLREWMVSAAERPKVQKSGGLAIAC